MPQLTKKLKVGLLLLAGVLPETFQTFREKVLGEQLLTKGLTHLPDGQPIEKGGLYGRPAQRPVNHGKRLCRAYEVGGRKAVLTYCRPHIEPEHLGKFEAKLSELLPG